MATINTATLILVPVDAIGNVVNKNTATIGQMATTSSEIRVNPDTDLPNTIGYPTIAEYLNREAADGMLLAHLDQTYVITQKT
jgi:hypothetical protein